jgi:hypothetical protein
VAFTEEIPMTQKTTSENRSFDTTSAQGASAREPSDIAVTQLRDGLAAGARDLSTEVRHAATDLAGEAKKTAESKLGAGKDFAAEHLGSVADALRKTSHELRSSESAVTEYVDMAASSVEKVSAYFQTRTLSQLMSDAEGFARREPAVFLGGALFLGMLGGRFLKSASPARPQAGVQAGVTQSATSSRSPAQSSSRQAAGGASQAPQKGRGELPAYGASFGTSGVPMAAARPSATGTSVPKPSADPNGTNRPSKSSGVS